MAVALIPRQMQRVTRSMLLPLAPLALVAGGSVGLAEWVYWSMTVPARTSLATAEIAYQLTKQEKTQIEDTIKVQVQARSVQAELAQIWRTLPTQDEFSSLALAVSELGRAEGVTIPGMNYALKPEKERAVASEATLTFQAIGTYAGIYRFIHQLEHHSTYMVIDKLQVRQVVHPHETSQPMISFSVTLTTFLRPPLQSRRA
ncbi:MAG: type 4a pilus biogenesis protein PilO [Nitrospira sp.]|nr:type 4a pilus biogenesis protein PilO [Nitrospira sp.]